METQEKKKIHVFVEITKQDVRKIEFDTDHVTGAQIKAKAGVPSNSDLGKREHGKIIHIQDNQTIEIKNGDHFVILPSGTIS